MAAEHQSPRTIVVGVLSDTHGHLYPAVKKSLEGVDHIIHAGDVGSLQVLAALQALAPVTAVRGNCDLEAWASSLPNEAEVELGGVAIVVRHIARGLATGSSQERLPRVVVTGHTHRPTSEERDGVLYLNPGSAGPERFGRPRTMARLVIQPSPVARPRSGTEPVSTGGPGLTAESAQIGAGDAGVTVEFQVVPDS